MPSTTTALLFSITVGASASYAQPSLVPPAGPIDESSRFGNRIELTQNATPGDADSVFRIDAPGSYVLTGDIDVPGNDIGIEIASSDVTLDLNGYTIRGVASTGTGVGVSVPETMSETFENLRIVNGTLRDLQTGVSTRESVRAAPDDLENRIDDVVIEDLRVNGVAGGLSIGSGRVERCRLRGEDVGIDVASGDVIGCSVTLSAPGPTSATGIFVGGGAVRHSSVTIANSQAGGIIGIRLRNADAIGCVVTLSGDAPVGIFSPFGVAVVSGCSVRADNNTVGASVAYRCEGVVTGCVAEGVDTGFDMDAGVLRSCAAIGVTTPATLDPAVMTADNNF